tara:strand:+ start:2737 stop:2949 length:213 start_codon:yes stop_codon:yes gene_type:complete
MNKKDVSSLFLAIIAGIGIGMLSTRSLAVVTNNQAKHECKNNNYRKLIYIHTVIGDTWHCVPAHFFNQNS